MTIHNIDPLFNNLAIIQGAWPTRNAAWARLCIENPIRISIRQSIRNVRLLMQQQPARFEEAEDPYDRRFHLQCELADMQDGERFDFQY